MKKESIIKILIATLVVSLCVFIITVSLMRNKYEENIDKLEVELKVEKPLITEDTSFIYIDYFTSRTSGEELEFTCHDTFIIINCLKDVDNVTFFVNFYNKDKLIIQAVNKTFGALLKGESAIIDFSDELNFNSIKNATQFRVAKINYKPREER